MFRRISLCYNKKEIYRFFNHRDSAIKLSEVVRYSTFIFRLVISRERHCQSSTTEAGPK